MAGVRTMFALYVLAIVAGLVFFWAVGILHK
jgi:hypothetical protein